MTDDQLIAALAFDFRFHYALGIEDIERDLWRRGRTII